MICMRRCKCCQMPYFMHFLFFVIIQNIAEFFETDGKLLVSIVRLEFFIWREGRMPSLIHDGYKDHPRIRGEKTKKSQKTRSIALSAPHISFNFSKIL